MNPPAEIGSADRIVVFGSARFRGPTPILRVGILVGPHDPTDRFTWWTVRLTRALAGDAARTVLAPGDPDRVVQYTDARDVAEFAVAVLDRRAEGVFDTVGPGRAQPLSAVLDACLRAAGGAPGDVDRVWAGERYLRENLHDLEEEQRPLWFPEDQIPQERVLRVPVPPEVEASGAIHHRIVSTCPGGDRRRELMTRPCVDTV